MSSPLSFRLIDTYNYTRSLEDVKSAQWCQITLSEKYLQKFYA